MIFVTVGTHEQQFNRLLKEVDTLVENNIIKDKVIVQTGYSDYELKHCQSQKFFGYAEMEELIEKASIVITHGGPATFMGVLAKGKIPIVVPRQKKFDEHVNDHQLDFCNKVKEQYPIIVVDHVKDLADSLHIDNEKIEVKSHNREFCERLAERIVV